MKLFIVHHSICLLKKTSQKNFIDKVNICKLSNEKCKDISFGSNKFIYYLANNIDLIDDEFIGIADANWNSKFKNVCKIQYLNTIKFKNNTIYSPCISSTWYEDSINIMSETKKIIDDAMNVNSIFKKNNVSIMSSNFICHKDIMKKYAMWFKENFEVFFDKYQDLFDISSKKKQAFFYERLTSIYFSNQNYEFKPIQNTSHCFKI